MGRPMPSELRTILRSRQHAAHAIECTHCGAHRWQPCTSRSKRRRLDQPHDSRTTAWTATQTAGRPHPPPDVLPPTTPPC